MTNAEKIKMLMDDYGLKQQDVAEILNVSLHTVRAWMLPERSRSHRNCPDWAVTLLDMNLATK